MPVIMFAVKKIPPEWEDYTSYQYWKINNELGTWEYSNSRWSGANENIDLSPVYDWVEGFRPESIRISHTVSSSFPDLRLYDTESNVIATADTIPASGEIIDITWQGYDIGRLEIIENGTTTIRVKPIEFLTSDDSYVSPHLYEWDPDEKSADMEIDPANGLRTYKGAAVGQNVRTIILNQGRSSGKYYFEVRAHSYTALTNCYMGIRKVEGDGSEGDYENSVGSATRGYGYLAQGRFYSYGSNLTSDPLSWATSLRWRTLGCAVDFTLGYIWFSMNGVWTGKDGDSPDPETGTDPGITGVSGTFFPGCSIYYESGTYLTDMFFQGTAEKCENIPAGFSPWDPTT